MNDNEKDQFAMILKERNDFALKSKHLRAENKAIRECLQESINLMEDVRSGDYQPDSFTTQPWSRALLGGE